MEVDAVIELLFLWWSERHVRYKERCDIELKLDDGRINDDRIMPPCVRSRERGKFYTGDDRYDFYVVSMHESTRSI